MYKIVLFFIIGLILISSCSENITKNDDEELIKIDPVPMVTSWYSSSWQTWPTHSETIEPNCYTWQASDLSFSFSYRNYVFTFKKKDMLYSQHTVEVYVNDDYIMDYDWPYQDDAPYSTYHYFGWQGFNYDGKNFNVKVKVIEIVKWNSCTQYYIHINEPYQIQVQVEETYLEAPTGFNVSPSVHDGGFQPVTISWNASTDTDVTGYEIYRGLYNSSGYLVGSYTLVQTINSRSTTSWVNIGIRWNIIKGAYYKIRSKSSTLGITSNFTPAEGSIVDGYDGVMP